MSKKDELKSKIDDLMNQYDEEEIDGETYLKNMMDLTNSYKNNNKHEQA